MASLQKKTLGKKLTVITPWVSLLLIFMLDHLSFGRNQSFHRGLEEWGQTTYYQYSECGLNISLLSFQHVP